MADEVASTPAVVSVAELQSPAAVARAKSEKERASAEKWAAVAVDALNGKKTEEAEEPAPEPKPAAKAKEKTSGKETTKEAQPKEKQRGADGKFLSEAAKSAAAEKPAGVAPVAKGVKPEVRPDAEGSGTADKGGEEPEAGTAASEFGGLGKAKRLAREGDVAGAMKLIGLDPEKIPGGQWAAWRKENAKKEARVMEAHAEVERQRAQVKNEARELVSQLRPFAEAKQAIESGDEDAAFQLMFGKSVDEWQRGRLARMHRGDLSKDPAVTELTKRLDAERAERLKLEQTLREREERATAERTQAEYMQSLKSRIADHADERVAAAAELPWFVKMVRDERLRYYDPRTDTSISEEEAIENVFDEDRLTVAQWKQINGGLDPSGRAPSTQNRESSDRRGTDVKRAPKAPLSLSRSATVEAAPEQRRDSKQSLEHWSGIASKLAAQGK